MTAFVAFVTAFSMFSGTMSSVFLSMSANTGFAPVKIIALTVEAKVIGVVITSSPGPTPSAISAQCSPAVAEFTESACGAPKYSANSRSKRSVFGPIASQPLRMESATSAIASSPMLGFANGRKFSLICPRPSFL